MKKVDWEGTYAASSWMMPLGFFNSLENSYTSDRSMFAFQTAAGHDKMPKTSILYVTLQQF
jgi:hypothetical protein